MKKNLDEIRLQIDLIDKEIATLINQRFTLVKEVNNIKKEKKLPTLDKKREDYILKQNICYVENEYVQYYKSILKSVLENSKKYMDKDK